MKPDQHFERENGCRPGPPSGAGWHKSDTVVGAPFRDTCWIILADNLGLGEQISVQLAGAQQKTISILPGGHYKRIRRDLYSIRADMKQDYRRLFRAALKDRQIPVRVVHLWSVQSDPVRQSAADALDLSLHGFLHSLKELTAQGVGTVDISVVSNALQSSAPTVLAAIRDTLMSLAAVVNDQYPQLVCRHIDVDTSLRSTAQIAVDIIREDTSEFRDRVVAHHNGERWVQSMNYTTAEQNADVLGINGDTAPGVTEVQRDLVRSWQNLLAVENVSLDDDFFGLGGDSIIAVRLFRDINNTYGVDLSLSVLFEARTIRQLSALIELQSAQSPSDAPGSVVSRALVGIQPKGSKPPIHVISGLGGNVVKFQRLAFHLGEDQPMFGLLPRGLDGHEPFFTRIEDMASYYADAIQQTQQAAPYRLIGYSFGGIVAFETARQILARGGEVDFLGILDTVEPQYFDRIQKTLPVKERYRASREYIEAFVTGADAFERVKNVVARKLSGLTFTFYRALGRAVPKELAKMEDINVHAAKKYIPGNYPGKLTLFRSSERPATEGVDKFLGWQGAAARIEVVDIPTDHFNIFKEPNIGTVAEKLRDCLSGITERRPVETELSRS